MVVRISEEYVHLAYIYQSGSHSFVTHEILSLEIHMRFALILTGNLWQLKVEGISGLKKYDCQFIIERNVCGTKVGERDCFISSIVLLVLSSDIKAIGSLRKKI